MPQCQYHLPMYLEQSRVYLRLPGLLATGVRDALAHGAGIVAVLALRIQVPWLVHADLCSLRLPRQHSARSAESLTRYLMCSAIPCPGPGQYGALAKEIMSRQVQYAQIPAVNT